MFDLIIGWDPVKIPKKNHHEIKFENRRLITLKDRADPFIDPTKIMVFLEIITKKNQKEAKKVWIQKKTKRISCQLICFPHKNLSKIQV